MKKNLYTLLFIMLISLTANAQSTDNNIGLGVIIGEPTGISLAYWTSDSRSFSAGAAWSFGDKGNMHFHLDYLFHHFDIISINRGSLPLYFGLGGRLRIGDNEKVGVRLPLGAAYHFDNHPIEIFLEIVPIMDLIGDRGFSGNSGLGIRYYF